MENEQRLLMSEIVGAQASAIERRLSRSLSSTNILAHEINRNDGAIREFDSFAEEIINSLGGISNLQLAPAGVVRQIYPLSGNEKAIGYDIIGDESNNSEALIAIKSRQLTLAGPFELIQGGVAVIGRNPVFIEREGEQQFWGFTSALIFLDSLLAGTELDDLESKGYSYRLHRIHPVTSKIDIFSSSTRPIGNNSYAVPIIVPNARWTLTLSPIDSGAPGAVILGYLVSAVFGFLIAAALFYILKQTEVLREAKNIAVKASQSRDEFITSISHEIGTPLSGMIGVMELLRGTRLDRNQGRHVDTASNSANMLLTIINDMVDFSHIETGRFPVKMEHFVLAELIEDVAYILALAACDKGLELVSDIDPEVPHLVKSDPVRLRQVLNNLLNNAIKFTAQGVIVVYARRNGNLVEIGVSDTGVALSEIQKQKILQPFPGDDIRYRRRSDHSGVGLTISRRLVEAMGSTIHIESGSGPGNHIYFDIPVDQDKTAIYDWRPPRALQRLTVIILSPVEQRRVSIQKILAHWNISRNKGLNYSAESESELPDITPCDLVIIDQVGSGQGGNDLIEKFANRSDWRKTRFIHLLPQGINAEDGRADVRINKPLSQAQLYAALMDVVYRQSLKNKPEQGDKSLAPQLQGRRILLVEDNEINKTIVLEILEETGVDIDIAGDGAQAIEQVVRAEYDLILMDIQMPVMDGFEATREIRKLGRDFENIPIIAMTAYAQEGDSDKSIEAGMNHHMAKPFEPENFVKLVVDYIKGRSQ